MSTVLEVAPERERTGGHGRLAHAYPDGSPIALCGALRPRNERPYRGESKRCPECERASCRSWVGR